MLAGMNGKLSFSLTCRCFQLIRLCFLSSVAAGPELAAAVTNAGGLGVIGGVGYVGNSLSHFIIEHRLMHDRHLQTPKMLKSIIAELKDDLKDKNAPFGVDLLLPQVGGSARKTNKDYTGGQLDALIDIIIEEKAALFVCAVGVPPKHVIEKLHKAGIPVMNMVGAPKHAVKACELGVDLICAQAGEGGGHTGSIPFSLLIPEVVDICRKYKSPLTGKPVQVIAAGVSFSLAIRNDSRSQIIVQAVYTEDPA